MLQVGHARVAAQMGEQGADILRQPGNGAVDAFFRQQQRALDAMRMAEIEQRLLQFGVIRQRDEFIECGGEKLRHRAVPFFQRRAE